MDGYRSKGKEVVTSVWGLKMFPFSFPACCFASVDLKKGQVQPFLLNGLSQNSQHCKELNKFCPPHPCKLGPYVEFRNIFENVSKNPKKTNTAWVIFSIIPRK